MDTIRLSAIIFSLLFSSLSQATAILNTEIGTISATYGSAYPNSHLDEESIASSITAGSLTGEIVNHWSDPIPNYGWVSWRLSENGMTFRAGQDYSYSDDYGPSDSGHGFSTLDFLWLFSVEGDGAELMQDLLNYWGEGEIQSTLMDVTNPGAFVNLSAGANNFHDSNSYDLLNGHSYLLTASLTSQSSTADRFENEYFISVQNAYIAVPEPGFLWLTLLGIGSLGFVVQRRKKTQVLSGEAC